MVLLSSSIKGQAAVGSHLNGRKVATDILEKKLFLTSCKTVSLKIQKKESDKNSSANAEIKASKYVYRSACRQLFDI